MKLKKQIIITVVGIFLFGTQLVQSQIQKNIAVKNTKAVELFYQITNKVDVPLEYVLIGSENANQKIAFNFKNGGWLILNANSLDLLAFSEKGSFSATKNPLTKNSTFTNKTLSKNDTDIILNAAQFSTQKRNTLDNVDPFLPDTWGGVNCYDSQGSNVYPTNHFTPNHCSPGCVAISTSQILHYYEWPIKGMGSHVYADNYDGTFMRHKAFFDDTTYDWNNMLNEYMHVDSTVQEQEAVGTLMYQVGVSVEMDYELTGSTNNLDNVPFALANFFRFTGTYHSDSWGSFWSELNTQIQLLRPVPIAIHNSANSEGHVMVANGFRQIGNSPYYHINWGWYDVDPTNNAWYNIQSWQAGDQGYDVIDGAIFYMLPEPQIMSITPNGTGDDFVVSWEVSNQLNWSEFTLEQKVDQDANWTEVASGITQKNYTITNPSGNVYQFRVKAKVDGSYYQNSWSEVEVYAKTGTYNGYASFESNQLYAYAKQTPNNALDFTGDYTFETWLRVHPGNQSGDVIMDEKDVFGLTIEEVTTTDYSVKFKNFTNNMTLNSNASGAKPLNDTWVHVAVSKTGNTTKLFIDGVLRDTATSGFNLAASNNYLNIGEKYHGSYSSWIIADMDQLRISTVGRYNSAFTPDQAIDFTTDANTTAYFTFQNVHKVRLKDEMHNISVVVKNAANYVQWKLDSSSTASVNQQEFNAILQVYPNPTADYLTIDYSTNPSFNLKDLTFVMYNENGQQVKAFKVTQENNKIDLSTLTSGMYFLNVKGNNLSATQQIIKK